MTEQATTKLQLVDLVADKLNVTKKVAKAVITAVTESVTEMTITEGRCQVWDFGTFNMVHRDARKGHNPKTGESIQIAASNQFTFRAARSLKDRANA